MTVDSYVFGTICIDGETYNADVIIYPDHVLSPWWRAEGHNLSLTDLRTVVESPPEILVIGTGYYGRMRVPAETLEALQKQGIETHVYRTHEAVAEFNRLLEKDADIVAAFHLTC